MEGLKILDLKVQKLFVPTEILSDLPELILANKNIEKITFLLNNVLISLKGQDKPGGCYFREPTTGFPRYLLNASHTVKTSSHLIQSLSTPIPPAEQ